MPEMRNKREGPSGLVLLLALGLGCLMSGCAGDLVVEGKGPEAVFRHRSLAYRIATPLRGDEGAWKRIEVDGADLAFRDPTGSSVSLLSRCEGPAARPRILARHLTIGLEEFTLLESGSEEVDGQAAWFQIFDAVQNHGQVRVKTVTTRVGHCTFDFVLVAAESYPQVESRFDVWWDSFRRSSQAVSQAAQTGEESSPQMESAP